MSKIYEILDKILDKFMDINKSRNIFVSTEEPTSADGNDGDIWIKYGD